MLMKYVQANLDKNIEDFMQIQRKTFDKPYNKKQIQKKIKGKKHWLYFAKDKNKIIGFKLWYDNFGEIYSWLGGVLKEYRRKGIASKLLEIQIRSAKNLNYNKINLKSHKGHPEMLLFCKSKGFKQVKIEKDHWGVGLDAIFFEMEI